MKPKLCFLVADGARGRLILRRGSGAYETLRTIEGAKAYTPRHDTRSRVFASASGVASAVDDDVDSHERERDRFAASLAEMVDEAAQTEGLFEDLVLVAPARLIRGIKPRLGAEARRKLARELPKDLTKLPEDKLRDRLEHISLAPVQS